MRFDQEHSSEHTNPSHDIASHAVAPRLTIKVRGLGDGPHPVRIEGDASLLDYAAYHGQVVVYGTLLREGERIQLDLTASAFGDFDCTRCATPFSRTVRASVKPRFVPQRLERDPDDPDVHVFDAGHDAFIDITEDVRDALILAIPMKHLCRPDCKGICSICGANRNAEDCGHSEELEGTLGFAALKSLGERLRAQEIREDFPTGKNGNAKSNT